MTRLLLHEINSRRHCETADFATSLYGYNSPRATCLIYNITSCDFLYYHTHTYVEFAQKQSLCNSKVVSSISIFALGQILLHSTIQPCCVYMFVVSADLTLSFMNPRLLDDVSFHPCVRYKRWEVRELHYAS